MPTQQQSWAYKPGQVGRTTQFSGMSVLSLLRRVEEGGLNGSSELPVKAVSEVLAAAEQILLVESNVIKVESKKTLVAGDLHGNFQDLMHGILSKHSVLQQEEVGAGLPVFHRDIRENFDLDCSLVFLGNYVNHGQSGCDVMLTLLLLKIARPNRVFLLRGNHETKIMGEAYGFKTECDEKYGSDIFARFLRVFQAMPLAAVVQVSHEKRVLCMHGGISRDVQSLDSIAAIQRNVEPERDTPLSDVLWSDPASVASESVSGKSAREVTHFAPNVDRGCGAIYGWGAVQGFLASSSITCLIRGHQVYEKGYHVHFGGNDNSCVISIFSCPNHCGSHGNEGAVLVLHDDSSDATSDSMSVLARLTGIPSRMYSFEHHPRTPPLEFRNRSARVFEELGVTAPYMPTSGAGLVREAMAFARLRHIASGRSEAFLAPSRFNAVAAACRELEKHPELTAKTAKNGLSLPGAISSGQEGGGGMAPEARFDNGMKQFCGKFLKPGFFTDGEARSLQQLFCLLDTDGDSYINLGDLISCSMEDSDSPFAESDMMNHVRTAMNALDADEDGFLGVADYLKFAARLKGFHKQATSASPGKSSAPSSPVRGSQHGSALLSVRSPAPASSLSDRLSLGMLHWPFKAEAVELAAEALGPSISPVSQTTFLSQPLSVPVDEAQNEHSAGDSNVEMPILRKYIIDGAHSRVFEGSFSGKPVSVKVEPLPSDVARQAATLKHLTLLRELSHQNIGPSLMAAFHDATRTMRVDNESHIYFVSSLCPLGALREIAANTLKSRHDEWPLKIRLAQDVASGITYLHNRSILHRDIKTVNIVVDSNFTAKICDFHSAVYLYSSEVQRVLNCTSEFLAPEVAASVASPGLSSDMFSFGICLCELICGPGVPEQPPKFFRRSEKDGYALDKQDVRLRADKKCPHALVELAFSCCQTDPNRRPSASITTSAISSMYEDTYGRKPTVPPTGIMPETRIPPPSIMSIAPTSPRDKLISYREGTVIANAADSHGQALTLKEATMTAGMSNRMDEMMRELDTLRVEKEEFRLQLDSERHAKEQMLDDFESKYQDLDGSFKSQQQVNGELADRLELLERMYATTRSELNEAKGSFNYALPNRQSSQQAGLGNDIPTVIQAVGLSRAKPNSTGHLSSAETFTTWHKKFRSTESRDDGNSVSMLWDAHSDLGARIDELVQACMHGRAHESLGEDILRNRVLDQVQDVAREYNETVISGLEDCSSIIDRALRKLEDPGDEHGGNGSEDVTTLEALTPGPAGVGLFDDESESGADTMLDTVGDGADVSDGETILSGMDMSSVAPPSYAAPPPPSFEAQKFPPQQQPPQPPPQGATSKAAVSAASLEAKLRATSLKAYLGADRR